MKKKIVLTFITFALIIFGYFELSKFFTYQHSNSNTIDIVMASPITSLNPFTFTESNDQRLRQIYEPLVVLDNELNIKPNLAVSFGRLDDLTWEFRLKPGIKFHDGSILNAQTVKKSFDTVMSQPQAQSYIRPIAAVTVTGEYTINIVTKFIDPILLNQIAQIPIIPDQDFEQLSEFPIGTGPYKFKTNTKNFLTLEKFNEYHGDRPEFDFVRFATRTVAEERVNFLNTSNDVALVYPYPILLKEILNEKKYSLQRTNNLSVNFFLFNFSRGWNNTNLRNALVKSLKDSDLSDLIDELGQPTAQYVSRGVFGYDSSITQTKFQSRDELEAALKSAGLFGHTIRIAMAEDLKIFKDFLRRYWARAGLESEIDLIDVSEIAFSSKKNDYDLIFLGWKSDFADAGQFLESIARTNSAVNIVNHLFVPGTYVLQV
jgi:peptide/nickel transport system substrate-binding protein